MCALGRFPAVLNCGEAAGRLRSQEPAKPLYQHNNRARMASANIDYSLYLVTDSTPAILGERNLVDVVEAALSGGVTICQYRDKTSDTVSFISCHSYYILQFAS